jgi:hypothetical protein
VNAEPATDPTRAHLEGRFPCFDGLRAMAALMVVLHHAGFTTAFELRGITLPGTQHTILIGHYLARMDAGVQVFFLISGFLLYRPYFAEQPIEPKRRTPNLGAYMLEMMLPTAVLAGFFLFTVILTQPMANAACALILSPIAIHTANGMHANPRAFAIAISIAASCTFPTPLEPVTAIVYGPGKYRFRDYVRVGGLLTLVVFAVTLVVLPIFWPL